MKLASDLPLHCCRVSLCCALPRSHLPSTPPKAQIITPPPASPVCSDNTDDAVPRPLSAGRVSFPEILNLNGFVSAGAGGVGGTEAGDACRCDDTSTTDSGAVLEDEGVAAAPPPSIADTDPAQVGTVARADTSSGRYDVRFRIVERKSQ